MSPHREIRPTRLLSPDWFITGVSPNAGPTALELLKRPGMSIVLTNPKATTGPTPGMVIKRRQVASFRTMDNTLRLRQVEGLLGSVLPLMGLALAVPDHTTLSRRARNMAIAQQGACSPGPTGRAGAYSCRQHWTAGLRRGPMVGGEAWRQIPPWLVKAACGTGCR